MNLSALAANSAWATASMPAWLRFRAALADPEHEQRQLLSACLKRNAGTVYGRRHGFAAIRSAEEYQARVPLTAYEDYASFVDRAAGGESGVLTAEPLLLLEPTGGSSAAAKLIPYTRSLRAEFGRAISPWIVDLFMEDPRLAAGPAYWSVSPAMRTASRGETVPVGFDEDSEYLGGMLGRLVGSVLAVPGGVRLIEDMDSFRYVTLAFLLACRELRLISVWHPSFLSLLLEAMAPSWERLLRDLTDGRLRPPQPLPAALAGRLVGMLCRNPRRAAELGRLKPTDTGRIWPKLRLVSCWGDAHAALSLPAIARILPSVRVQPKGLIATEAFVTLPFGGQHLLAVRSHFFEFLDDGGRPFLAHRLDVGGIYNLAVTTGGGLYRYRLRDRVQVGGMRGRTPALRFLGKEDCVSDLCGEKLSEEFVAGVLARDLAGLRPTFAMLAPDCSDERSGYTLFLESPERMPAGLASAIDAGLAANPHYRYCIDLGQLRPLCVVPLPAGAYAAYLRRCRELGQRPGDVKPRALSPRMDWASTLGAGSCLMAR